MSRLKLPAFFSLSEWYTGAPADNELLGSCFLSIFSREESAQQASSQENCTHHSQESIQSNQGQDRKTAKKRGQRKRTTLTHAHQIQLRVVVL